MTSRHSVTLLASAVLAVGLLTGCGSSKSSSSSSAGSSPSGSASSTTAASTGGGSGAVATDNEAYAQYLNPKPALTIAPLGKKAPTGKTMDVITCPVPICAVYTSAAQQAAQALGWKTKVLVSQFSPSAFQATWNTIDRDKPTVVFDANQAPLPVISKQVLAAKANGSVLVAYGIPQAIGTSGSTPAARAFVYNANGLPAEVQQGRVQALQIIHDAKGPASVLALTDPSVGPVVMTEVASEKATLQAAGDTVDVVAVSSANIGTLIPQTVSTYLRAHPAVKYVTVPFDDYTTGIPQAIASAGLSGNVKLIGSSASASSQKEVEAGQIFASSATPTTSNAWWMIDAAVRTLVSDHIPNGNPAGPLAILTKSTSLAIGSATAWPSSIYSQFRKAWGVG